MTNDAAAVTNPDRYDITSLTSSASTVQGP
uniref:Uncharacterized protein n=1 Tax=Medicago truncatula TaxID=3880 RepID=I3SZ61_MEDTR|nr:unknown [Medicago truncatula]